MGQKADWAEVGDYWPKDRTPHIEGMLDTITSRKFHDMMDDRMLVSHYKYGHTDEGYPEKSRAVDNVMLRLDEYLKTGNVEYLVDAANFCMIEFMHPSQPNAFLKATDSDGSPGILYQDGRLRQGKHEEVKLND